MTPEQIAKVDAAIRSFGDQAVAFVRDLEQFPGLAERLKNNPLAVKQSLVVYIGVRLGLSPTDTANALLQTDTYLKNKDKK